MSDKKNGVNHEENNDLPVLTDKDIENLDLKSKKMKKLIKQYKKQTGKHAIWRNTITEEFKKWLRGEYDILLIEDDLSTIRLLTAYFKSKGYSCHGVVNGSKGLEELGRTSPKVILLEIDSLNGYDICKMIKSDKEYKKIPIYFLTAISGSKGGFDWPTGGWGTEYFRDDHYINKPFSLTDFEVIFDILNRFKLEKQEP